MDITATTLRRKLHTALQAVANGDTVRITKHGKLIAIIEKPQPDLIFTTTSPQGFKLPQQITAEDAALLAKVPAPLKVMVPVTIEK